MDDRALDQVVGDGQQGADGDAIALRPFPEPRLAVARRRQLLGVEAALGAGRHDDCVLHHLGLQQAEDFGAEVVAPVGPAQAAARSEEHTSELQSLMRISYAGFCVKKKHTSSLSTWTKPMTLP